jgi:hypothetical protein
MLSNFRFRNSSACTSRSGGREQSVQVAGPETWHFMQAGKEAPL